MRFSEKNYLTQVFEEAGHGGAGDRDGLAPGRSNGLSIVGSYCESFPRAS